MSFEAKILASSESPDGVVLDTFEITFPRIILAEFNTHRMFSRNSASSRAIPVEKMIERVMSDPYIPSSWGKNQKGMQAGADLSAELGAAARMDWLQARYAAVTGAQRLLSLGVHKQLTNRLLEPFMWHTCIVTATEWSNFFHLRNNAMAHPDIQTIARMMQELYEKRIPNKLNYGQWHLPYYNDEDGLAFNDRDPGALPQADLIKASIGRCARVSYLTHDGKCDLDADIRLHDQLLAAGHMSPFEHVARPWQDEDRHYTLHDEKLYAGNYAAAQWSGNFRGWVSYRKTIPGEADILAYR